MLTVSVENFGPIREGTVELRPLTVFVGPNNTGKSYMAMLIYAVARKHWLLDFAVGSPLGARVGWHSEAAQTCSRLNR